MMADVDIDEFGFRKYEEDFIFIACSSDLTEQRIVVEHALRDELQFLGEEHVKVYSWDTAMESGGFDQRFSMQKNIPRPSAENCLGVIYLLGERLGFPLEFDFEREWLGDSGGWLDDEPYQAVIDWPEKGDEVASLLGEGKFPLTGGLFEFLAARGHRGEGYEHGKPCQLIVFADEEVGLNGGEVHLNKSKWLNWVVEKEGMNRVERRRWEDAVYEPQVMGVHNFLRACAKRNIAQNVTGDHEVLAGRVREFVRGQVFSRVVGNTNPYRELGYYNVHDGEHFYGQGDFVAQVVEHFNKQLEKEGVPAACAITGFSGSGKSSVLRAGILRELDSAEHRGRYRWADMRPEVFKNQAGLDMDVIDTLLNRLDSRAGIELSGKQRQAIQYAGANAPAEAAAAVMEVFRAGKKKSGSEYLILAIDQFEEIIDELSSRRRREYWQPLLDFLEAASGYPEFGLFYTLESTRLNYRVKLAEPFKSAFREEVDDATGSFVENVIRHPFAKTGYPLGDDVVQELKERFAKLREENLRAARNSVLPLLALKLHSLWDHVSNHFEATHDSMGGVSSMRSAEDMIGMGQLEQNNYELDFEGVINELAEKAWLRAGVGEVEDSVLDNFLQPLVGVEGKGSQIQLNAAPRSRPYETETKLTGSFRRHRLLVDVGGGLVRLVHQAVIDHWKDAAGWLGKMRGFLEMEARLRVEADDWDHKGRKAIRKSKHLEAKIGEVVDVMRHYFRSWSRDEEKVHEADLTLRDYCLEVFGKATDPRVAVVDGASGEVKGNYMGLAATYGLTEMVEKFGKVDEACLHDLTSEADDATRPLGTAAWSHLSTVRYLLDQGADPLAKTAHGWPPVAAAIYGGGMQIFRMLMEAAALRCEVGRMEKALMCPGDRSLVHLAASENQEAMILALLEHYGFSADTPGGASYAPIHYAALGGSAEVFEVLRRRVDITGVVDGKRNCLHVAAIEGHVNIVDRILKLPDGREMLGQKDKYGYNALHLAAANLHPECVTTLLKAGVDPNEENEKGWRAVTLLLSQANALDKDAKLDVDRALATLRALLADERLDLDVATPDGSRLLKMAEGIQRLLRVLLEDARIDLRDPVEKDGDSGVFLAARKDVWSAVKHFITEYGLPEGGETDEEGNTFLHHLTSRTAPSDLLFNRVNEIPAEQLNALNKKNQTVLVRAIEARNWPLAERLLDTGLLDLHLSGRGYEWGLWGTLEKDGPESVMRKFVEQLGDRLWEVDERGWSLLHHVAANNHLPYLERFAKVVELDGQWEVKDELGRRAVDFVGESLAAFVPKGLKGKEWPKPMGWDEGVVWKVVNKTQSRAFLKKHELKDFSVEEWCVCRGELPFYPGQGMVRLECRDKEAGKAPHYYLEDEENIYALKGISPPIHEFNAKHVELTVDLARQYLHFFCFFVRGEEGPFFVAEDPSNATLSKGTTKEDREKVGKMGMPTWYLGETKEGFGFLGRIFYSNAMFNAYFHVHRTGMIEMEDDIPVVADLSGHVDMPLG